MNTNELLPSLAIFTLIAVLIIAVVIFARFMRKPGNRHPMDTPRGKAIQEVRDEEVTEARANDEASARR